MRLVANPVSKHRDAVTMESMFQSLALLPAAVPLPIPRVVQDSDTVKESAAEYVCQECGAKYAQYGRLANHLKNKHEIVKERELFNCDQCEKTFDTVKKLIKSLTCNICSYFK